MNNFVYNDVYGNIIYSDNPKNIINGSTLRHYINVWGITEKLCNYFNTTKEKIRYISEICRGNVEIKGCINNMDNFIKFCEEEERNRIEVNIKNNELINILKDKRETLCGVGTRKVKCFLNCNIKKGDELALLYRKVLECEDKNIKAKESYGEYQEKIYKEKTSLINEIIEISKEKNYKYGYQESDVRGVKHVIFFELPNVEQISWHNTLSNIEEIPFYTNEWDGKVNSTLDKIEDAINKIYGEEIIKKYK